MNWPVVVPVVALILGVFANAIVTAYYSGRVAQKVDSLADRTAALEKSDDQQWSKITETAEHVAVLRGKAGRVNGGL